MVSGSAAVRLAVLCCVAVLACMHAYAFDGTIRIGAAATVTGTFAAQYVSQNVSWQMWLDYVNGAGGGLEAKGKRYAVEFIGRLHALRCCCGPRAHGGPRMVSLLSVGSRGCAGLAGWHRGSNREAHHGAQLHHHLCTVRQATSWRCRGELVGCVFGRSRRCVRSTATDPPTRPQPLKSATSIRYCGMCCGSVPMPASLQYINVIGRCRSSAAALQRRLYSQTSQRGAGVLSIWWASTRLRKNISRISWTLWHFKAQKRSWCSRRMQHFRLYVTQSKCALLWRGVADIELSPGHGDRCCDQRRGSANHHSQGDHHPESHDA